MFGSEILDVAIGLVFIYLLLSLVATAARELVEALTKSRAIRLERGIRTLLDDESGTGLAASLYRHPLIASLYAGRYEPPAVRRLGHGLPTYIPSASFSAALLDIVVHGETPGPYAAQQGAGTHSIDALQRAVARFGEGHVQQALRVAVDRAEGDIVAARVNVERWFDSAMDRVSGAYKRRTQLYLFAIGALLALGLNVNTVRIAQHLARDKAARETLVARATVLARDTTRRVVDSSSSLRDGRQWYDELQSLDLPIGWTRRQSSLGAGEGVFSTGIIGMFGLLLTALAITLGAPFWFDMLNKIVVVRSTVKPREKSGIEASKDPRPPESAATMIRAAEGAPAPASLPLAARAGLAAASTITPPFTTQEWDTGDDPDEGII